MDKETIRNLYEKYGSLLHRRAFALSKNEEAASEILQDVFVSVIKYGDGFRGEASPYTWLYRMTTNAALNYLKKHKRVSLMAEVPEELLNGEPKALSPQINMQECLRHLNKEERSFFIYRYLDGLKQDEIAALMDVTRKTVYSKLESIHEKLKNLICI